MSMSSILPTPDLWQARRVLCVQPHYDDNDIGAGGTIARLAEEGAEVWYLTVTDDLMGVLDTSLGDDAARALLRDEQARAGAILGVKAQYWLDYPDAGRYDYFDLRRRIIEHIRMLSPDLVLAPDPWLPYEAHRDHIQTGQAAAEAAVLYALPRITTTPEVDDAYKPHELTGVAFYYSHEPNTAVDITSTWEKKAESIRSYRAQFSEENLEQLLFVLDARQRMYGEAHGFEQAEGLKVMQPLQLHCGL